MTRFLATATTLLILTSAGTALAQSRKGTGRASLPLNMTAVQTVTGAVTAVNLGYGAQYPSITVNQIQIKVAPVWYLLDQGFEVKTGDTVSVVAAPSTVHSDVYLFAIEITNAASNLRIVLRDAAGVPLWSGSGNVNGSKAAGGCVEASTIATVSGTIIQLNQGVGIQMPTLTLKTSDGSVLLLKLGPERVLLAADVELAVGDRITVKYARLSCTDELVVLSLTTASGQTLVLRNDDGTPAWR